MSDSDELHIISEDLGTSQMSQSPVNIDYGIQEPGTSTDGGQKDFLMTKEKNEKVASLDPELCKTEESDAEYSDSSSDGDLSECCAICLGRMKGDIGSPDVCDHEFCLLCILEWAKTNASCPQDRKPFENVIVRATIGGEKINTIPIEPSKEIVVDDEDVTVCEICENSENEERLLLCDGCDLGYHLYCLTPPLLEIPVVEWFCPMCVAINVPKVLRETAPTRRQNRRRRRSRDPIIIRTGRRPRMIPRTRATERILVRIARTRESFIFNGKDKTDTVQGFNIPKPFGSWDDDDIDATYTKDELADKILGQEESKISLSNDQKKALAAEVINKSQCTPLPSYCGSNSINKSVSLPSVSTADLLSDILSDQSTLLSKSKDITINEERKLVKTKVKSDKEKEETSSSPDRTILNIPLPSSMANYSKGNPIVVKQSSNLSSTSSKRDSNRRNSRSRSRSSSRGKSYYRDKNRRSYNSPLRKSKKYDYDTRKVEESYKKSPKKIKDDYKKDYKKYDSSSDFDCYDDKDKRRSGSFSKNNYHGRVDSYDKNKRDRKNSYVDYRKKDSFDDHRNYSHGGYKKEYEKKDNYKKRDSYSDSNKKNYHSDNKRDSYKKESYNDYKRDSYSDYHRDSYKDNHKKQDYEKKDSYTEYRKKDSYSDYHKKDSYNDSHKKDSYNDSHKKDLYSDYHKKESHNYHKKDSYNDYHKKDSYNDYHKKDSLNDCYKKETYKDDQKRDSSDDYYKKNQTSKKEIAKHPSQNYSKRKHSKEGSDSSDDEPSKYKKKRSHSESSESSTSYSSSSSDSEEDFRHSVKKNNTKNERKIKKTKSSKKEVSKKSEKSKQKPENVVIDYPSSRESSPSPRKSCSDSLDCKSPEVKIIISSQGKKESLPSPSKAEPSVHSRDDIPSPFRSDECFYSHIKTLVCLPEKDVASYTQDKILSSREKTLKQSSKTSLHKGKKSSPQAITSLFSPISSPVNSVSVLSEKSKETALPMGGMRNPSPPNTTAHSQKLTISLYSDDEDSMDHSSVEIFSPLKKNINKSPKEKKDTEQEVNLSQLKALSPKEKDRSEKYCPHEGITTPSPEKDLNDDLESWAEAAIEFNTTFNDDCSQKDSPISEEEISKQNKLSISKEVLSDSSESPSIPDNCNHSLSSTSNSNISGKPSLKEPSQTSFCQLDTNKSTNSNPMVSKNKKASKFLNESYSTETSSSDLESSSSQPKIKSLYKDSSLSDKNSAIQVTKNESSDSKEEPITTANKLFQTLLQQSKESGIGSAISQYLETILTQPTNLPSLIMGKADLPLKNQESVSSDSNEGSLPSSSQSHSIAKSNKKVPSENSSSHSSSKLDSQNKNEPGGGGSPPSSNIQYYSSASESSPVSETSSKDEPYSPLDPMSPSQFVKSVESSMKGTTSRLSSDADSIEDFLNDYHNRIRATNRQELESKVVEQCKKCLDPYYQTGSIKKDMYKEIVHKSVSKILRAEASLVVDSTKIKKLVEGYVKVYQHRRKKKGSVFDEVL